MNRLQVVFVSYMTECSFQSVAKYGHHRFSPGLCVSESFLQSHGHTSAFSRCVFVCVCVVGGGYK